MNRSKPTIAVLIPTCSAYSDVLPVLHASQVRFWPRLPFPLYYINEGAPATSMLFNAWTPINVGAAGTWSANLLVALRALDAFDHVFIWMDDFILTGDVDPNLASWLIETISAVDPAYLRLNPSAVRRREPDARRDVVPLRPRETYRTSMSFSIWKRTVLQSLLHADENAWEFEIAGSHRSEGMSGFYSTTAGCLNYSNLVVQRYIYPPALREIEAAGLAYSGDRAVMSPVATAIRRLRVVRSRLFSLLPHALQARLRRLLILGQYRGR